MAITKTLEIKIGDQSFEVPVTFRVIEIAEAVFDCTADQVIGYHLIDASRIKRTLVARVITQWVNPPKDVSRQELYEQVVVCSASKLTKYAGAIQGAIAFALSYVDDEQLQMLANGQDLPMTDDAVAGGSKRKK
jgi:hypothetical protein